MPVQPARGGAAGAGVCCKHRGENMNAQTAFILFIVLVVLAIFFSRSRAPAKDADLAITAAVNAALAKEFQLSNVQVDVKTFDGVVILGGFTHEYGQVRRAVEIAGGIQGVKSVENRISIRSGH